MSQNTKNNALFICIVIHCCKDANSNIFRIGYLVKFRIKLNITQNWFIQKYTTSIQTEKNNLPGTPQGCPYEFCFMVYFIFWTNKGKGIIKK